MNTYPHSAYRLIKQCTDAMLGKIGKVKLHDMIGLVQAVAKAITA